MGISVVIHTYNSEKHLEKCLESVKNCEEIVICDMHSTDNTIKIAQKYGAKIIYHENIGFADPARNFALTHATQDWVLVLDSDEEIPGALLEHLKQLITTLPGHVNGVFIPRKNLHLGHILWLSYPNPILRFFRKGTVSFSEKVHCAPTILAGGDYHIDPKRTELAIIHYNHDSIESFL
ncbi:MAG: glycosyltransferase family 2 protein, partial [Candidatus Aenigmarchaeota archaeon]|nr:glycosyltransferase family 2 protein [Candidatus Aenigmarchaeota archaeon]